MLNEWQKRRSEFNHDWLNNRFLNRLNGFLVRLQEAKPDAERLARFLSEDLPEWKQHEPEARWLVESVEQEMSPRRFFDGPLLNRCDEDTKRWLPNAVHEIWLARYTVRRLQNQTRALISQADERYQRLQKALRYGRPTDLAGFGGAAEGFYRVEPGLC